MLTRTVATRLFPASCLRAFTTVDKDQLAKFSSEGIWYESRQRLLPYARLRVDLIHKMAAEHFSPREFSSLSILDVGCGAGLVAEELARRGGHVLGIDPGKVQVGLAQRFALRSPDIAPRLKYEVTTAEELVERHPAGYDLVVCSQVLEHVPHYQRLVGLISRLLKVFHLVLCNHLR